MSLKMTPLQGKHFQAGGSLYETSDASRHSISFHFLKSLSRLSSLEGFFSVKLKIRSEEGNGKHPDVSCRFFESTYRYREAMRAVTLLPLRGQARARRVLGRLFSLRGQARKSLPIQKLSPRRDEQVAHFR